MKVIHLVHWKKSGIYVAVNNLKKEGSLHGDAHDIITLRQNHNTLDLFKSIFILGHFLLKCYTGKYDSINLHSFLPHIINLFLINKKSFLFFHSNYPFLSGTSTKEKLKKFFTKKSIKSASHPICVSKVVKQSVDAALDVDSTIVYNLIDSPNTYVTCPTKINSFGSIGRFDTEKRFLELIQKFIESNTGSSLHFAGDGALLPEANTIIAKHQKNNVLFHGRQESLSPFFKAIDAYICCSKYEGFGLAIAEAMLAGKIIISTHVGILKENLDFDFIKIEDDLSNLKVCIHLAEQLDEHSIAKIVENNRNIIVKTFKNNSIYSAYIDALK